ncbi:MAG: NADH-quinone oxidoreductase subunit C, partial [Desulfobacterales bacterium]|nr:NADH-quinone oxidoreductase subunit C [Desulfobacterales bacterium]
MLTLQVAENRVKDVLRYLKTEATPKYQRLDDLTAIDESARRQPQNDSDYTMVYHLLSFDSARRLRLKVPLRGQDPVTRSITDIWPSANWYEREVFDLMGIRFEGHPNLSRIIMPPDWQGHPLRKSFAGRASEMAPYTRKEAEALQPLDGGVYAKTAAAEHQLILNIGPHHVSTHGLLRYIA